MRSVIDKAWLQNRITVEEAEAASLAEIDELRAAGIGLSKPRVPFRSQRAEWEALKAQMEDGDELWRFSTPDETWEQMMGRAGIVLLRGGTIIATIVTTLN
jgi:hypothetical protein